MIVDLSDFEVIKASKIKGNAFMLVLSGTSAAPCFAIKVSTTFKDEKGIYIDYNKVIDLEDRMTWSRVWEDFNVVDITSLWSQEFAEDILQTLKKGAI